MERERRLLASIRQDRLCGSTSNSRTWPQRIGRLPKSTPCPEPCDRRGRLVRRPRTVRISRRQYLHATTADSANGDRRGLFSGERTVCLGTSCYPVAEQTRASNQNSLGSNHCRPCDRADTTWSATQWTHGNWRINRSWANHGPTSVACRCIHYRRSSGGGFRSMLMRRESLSKARSSPHPVGSSPRRWRSRCRSGAPVRQSKRRPMGSARWATRKEIEAAGLFSPDGVMLGRLDRAYLRHDGPNTSCASPRPDRARASASWYRPC